MFKMTDRASRVRRTDTQTPSILSPAKTQNVDRFVDAQQVNENTFETKHGMRWEIGAPVARGNEGAFYLSRRTAPGAETKIVGLKMAFDGAKLTSEFEAMMKAGSQLTSRLVKAGDVELLETPVCDTNLRAAAAEVGAAGVSNTAREAWAIDVLRRLSKRISYMHERGQLHRDIKPDNVYARLSGDIQLGDFGGAGDADAQKPLTGTPGFWSADMLRGRPTAKADDIWMFGVTALILVMGEATPFMLKEGMTPLNPDTDFPELDNDAFMSKMFTVMRESMNGYLTSREITAQLVPGAGLGRLETLREFNKGYFSELAQRAPKLSAIIMAALSPKSEDRPSMRELHERLAALQDPTSKEDATNVWRNVSRDEGIQQGIDAYKPTKLGSARQGSLSYQPAAEDGELSLGSLSLAD